MMQTNYKQRRGDWDKIYSSYYWKINLDPKVPTNRVPDITGYSKKIDEQEAQDKDYLLRKKIINLYTNGYFTKATHIEFYQRTGIVINKNSDPKILVIYPTHYAIPDLNFALINKKHGRFLTEFYDRLKTGKDLSDLLPAIRRVKSKDDFLDIHKQDLPTESHLYNYAARLSLHGHPSGAVTNFINSYKEMKRWQ